MDIKWKLYKCRYDSAPIQAADGAAVVQGGVQSIMVMMSSLGKTVCLLCTVHYNTTSPVGVSFGRYRGAAEGGTQRTMEREGAGISWRCQNERSRVLLWVKSLMRGSEHLASRRLPERQKQGEQD